MTFHTALECVSKIFTLWLTRISLLRVLALRNFDVDSDHFLVLHNLIRFFMTVDKVGCINLEILTRKWMMIFISLLPIAVGLIRTDKILFWSVNNFKRTRIFYRLILRRLKWVLFFYRMCSCSSRNMACFCTVKAVWLCGFLVLFLCEACNKLFTMIVAFWSVFIR